MSDPAPNFEGHEGRECGEHRTVGSHRAWCYDCSEWCYPEIPCRGCKIPQLEASLTEANKLLEQTIEVLEAADRYAQHCDRTWGVEVHIRNPYAAGHYGWQVWKAAKKAKPFLDNLKALKKERTE